VEVFVERAIRAPRKTEIAPIKRSAFPCNHIMTFPHELVWQYGGPSQQSGNEREIPPDADPQGFVGYPGARCNYTNPAVAIGRTSESLVVICQTGVGRFYYKGFGRQNGSSVEIDDPVPDGSRFHFRRDE
jgi:hypothetical protein